MNRLAKTRCYLCGAMDFAQDQGIGWRRKLQEDLFYMDIIWLDPTNKPTSVGWEGKDEIQHIRKLIKTHHYEEAAKLCKPIRHIDLRLVDICDFMIVFLDRDIHHCGTYEELFWANRMKKPVLIVIKQGKTYAPNWLFGTVPHKHIFGSLRELKAYLKYIAFEENIDTLGRWEFFNFKSSLEGIEKYQNTILSNEGDVTWPLK